LVIEKAARTAGIHEFIISLKDGYDSIVGEKGVNFSEGQKQRLSIARALIKSPDILILDEPTSALDSVIERSIFDALPEQISGKTLFVVSHRLSTIRKADRIMILNDKHLVEIGTHAELMEKNDYYRSINNDFNS
jgi:ABC-type multidrug transport system fused ATPase/permease subunit